MRNFAFSIMKMFVCNISKNGFKYIARTAISSAKEDQTANVNVDYRQGNNELLVSEGIKPALSNFLNNTMTLKKRLICRERSPFNSSLYDRISPKNSCIVNKLILILAKAFEPDIINQCLTTETYH